MIAYLVFKFGNRVSPFYICLFGCTLISCAGYMLICSSNSLESALYGNEIVYLGSSFAPYFMFLCVADLCKVKVPKSITISVAIMSLVIFLGSSSYGICDWYYKDVQLVIEGNLHYLKKTNGFLHILYPIYIAGCGLASLVITIGAMRRKKDVSYKNSIALSIVTIIASLIYGLEKALHIKIELIPFAFLILEIAVVIILRRVRFYDILSVTGDMITEKQTSGFVLFDNKGRYLASDPIVKVWFPEIAECKADYALERKDTEFLQLIDQWLKGEVKNESKLFERNEKFISVEHTMIRKGESKDIHCISLHDATKQQEYTRLVEQYNEQLTKDVEKKTEKISRIQDDITISMASIVENRDNNTGGHIQRTSDIIRIYSQHLRECLEIPEMTKEMKRYVTKAAPLHDFGKIGIPDVILNKPARFEPEEYEIMKTHADKGAKIVERILQNTDDKAFKRVAVNVAHYHHEKWDGSGYPEGLAGRKIPFEARVMALADVFDALVSKRVYKDRLSYEEAFRIIEESSGTHFDPELCREFLHCKKELIKLYESYPD